ncbi:MAG: SUF system NifU family Fe-S cluster assembly protein [Candidatus Latescibacterota bacterium]|nr:SUF system NifU family Fe-S cluster assembly protein [Candidatus Latescibacterota bacterium]
MLDTRELYQQILLDHNRSPRNFRTIDTPTSHAEGNNPLCGDTVSIDLTILDEAITDIAFQGAGCAISTASASLMTKIVSGKTRQQALTLFDEFRDLVTGQSEMDDPGDLAAFGGVRDYPSRIKCATLAWHTLRAAIEGAEETITTE